MRHRRYGRGVISRRAEGPRGASPSALVCIVLLCLSLLTTSSYALGLDDIPPNDDRRTLTRFAFPRTYPLSDAELQNTTSVDLQTLREHPYGLLAFRTANVQDKDVKRVIIMMHGQGRDGWLYQDQATEALEQATDPDAPSAKGRSRALRKKLKKLDKSETLIISPQFINEDDPELALRTNELAFDHLDELSKADPAQTMLQWQGNSWALGGDSISPHVITSKDGKNRVGAPPVSSFEALDAMIARISDGTSFPNLETIVVAGHSLGGQFVQRYALIGAVPARSTPVHFFTANAGSFAYLTPERARSTAECAETYDTWKFGLGVFGIRYLYDMVSDSLDSASDVTDVRVRYLRDRRVHYLFGLNDTSASGDRGCEAMAQGRFHLERGQNFMAHINKTAAQLNLTHDHSINYIPGVAHDALGIFVTPQGIQRLFLPNIDGEETVRGVGYADADAYRYPYRFNAAAAAAAASPFSSLSWPSMLLFLTSILLS